MPPNQQEVPPGGFPFPPNPFQPNPFQPNPFQPNPFIGISGMVNQILMNPDFTNLGNIFASVGVPVNGNLGDYSFGNFDEVLNRLFVNAGSRGTPPASQSALESLPQVTIEQKHVDEAMNCSICREEFNLGESVAELPCCHKFHGGCIVPWLKMHNQCPVCRFELPTDDAEYNKNHSGSL